MKVLLSLTLVLTWLGRCRGAAGVFTEPQVRARAGGSVLLPCLFLDPDSKGWTLHKVDWLLKAGAGTQEEMVFFYYSSHGVPAGRFKNRVQWRGNVSRWDGSILLQDLRLNDSGTYECELRLLETGSVFKSRTVLLVSPAAPKGTEDAAPLRDSGFWPAAVGCGCVAVVVAFLAGLCVRKRFAALTALERTGKSSSKSKAEVRAEAGGVTGDGVWVQGCGGRGNPALPRHQGPIAGQLQPWLSQLALGLGSGSPCVFGECSVPNSLICPPQEAIYSSVPGDEVAKAEQEAKKKRRAEDTYITMVRSCRALLGPPHHCQGQGMQGLTPCARPQHPVPPAPSKHTLVPLVRLTPCPLLPAAPVPLPGQRRLRGAGQEVHPVGMDGRGDTGARTEPGAPQQARGGTSPASRAAEIAVLWDGSPSPRCVRHLRPCEH
uniref:Ig-like domain-containing protein n=1 Tax=Taeniopygia guttata TaxID=59729 RepID=A0A674H0U3_TAEGU